MADTKSLNTIGLMLGAATMMVMMIGGVVISDHLSGRMQLDDNVHVVGLPATVR
jgi:translation initiation factor IF-1